MSAPVISPTLKQDNYGVILLNKINQRVAQKYSLFWSNRILVTINMMKVLRF